MNIFNVINRGARHADIVAQRDAARRAEALRASTELARAQWLNALFVDETRAWMAIGAADADVLSGIATMLTIAGFVHVYDCRDADTADLRVLRGAISAATQCSANGCRVSAYDARAFSAAAERAKAIIAIGTHEAIQHAAVSIREAVGLD